MKRGRKKVLFFAFFCEKNVKKKSTRRKTFWQGFHQKLLGETFGPKPFLGGEPKIFEKTSFFGKFQAFW